MKKTLLTLAPGFEETEALSLVDMLRRAGIEVVIAGTIDGNITGRSRITIEPDARLDDVMNNDFDMLLLAGGQPGTDNLRGDERVIRLVKKYAQEKKIAAICAAPLVLKTANVIEGRSLTCHPSVRDDFKDQYRNERVVIDANIITSQGPGTAIEFAYAIIDTLLGDETSKEINKAVLANL